MPLRRVALLTIFACVAIAGPAAASERSEARQFAAAMQPGLALTPEEAEAVVADYEARSAHVAATCLPAVKAAAKKADRALILGVVYSMHAYSATLKHMAVWLGEADARLAAIETDSRTLRRARAARAAITASFSELDAAMPADFCAMVTGWQAKRWKGDPPGSQALFETFDPSDDAAMTQRRMDRGSRLLRRHGATRAQRRAFNGIPREPDLREPAPDPVIEALGGEPAPERTSPDDGGRREP
jgi:hypothetical protein